MHFQTIIIKYSHINVNRMEVNSLESIGANTVNQGVRPQAAVELCDK